MKGDRIRDPMISNTISRAPQTNTVISSMKCLGDEPMTDKNGKDTKRESSVSCLSVYQIDLNLRSGCFFFTGVGDERQPFGVVRRGTLRVDDLEEFGLQTFCHFANFARTDC